MESIKKDKVILDKDNVCSLMRVEDATGVDYVITTPLGWFKIDPNKVSEMIKLLQI